MEGRSADRRKTPRTPLVLKVEYKRPKALLADYLTDLGHGGLFICTSQAFQLGETVAFILSFPGLFDPLELEGVVRWQRQPHDDPEQPPGVGLEFTFTSEAQRTRINQFLADIRNGPEERPNKAAPFRVLLVENAPLARNLFAHTLKKLHSELGDERVLEVMSAASSEEALQHLATAPPDLAVIECALGGARGEELIGAMRKRPDLAKTPILAMSVESEGARERALKAGADLYFDKPVPVRQLITTLKMLLTRRTTVQ